MTQNEMVPDTYRKQRAVTCNEDDIGSRERMTRDDRSKSEVLRDGIRETNLCRSER